MGDERGDEPRVEYLFGERSRRRALVYWVGVIVVLTVASAVVWSIAPGERTYLILWLCGACPLTTPSFFVTRRAGRIAGPPQQRFFRTWFIAMALLYACGIGIWILAWVSVPVMEALAPVAVLLPVGAFSTALTAALRGKSGDRNVGIDMLDCTMLSILVTAPVLALLFESIMASTASWYTFSAAIVAAVLPGAAVGSIELFLLLPKGERRAAGLSIALALAAFLNASLQVAQGLSGFTLPAAPLVAIQCVSMGLLFFMPFTVLRHEPSGLDRFPVQAQVRRRPFLPVVIAITVPLVVLEAILTYDERPWVVAYTLALLGALALVATFRESLASDETRRLYAEIERQGEQRKVLLSNLMHAVENDRHRVAAQLHEQAVGGLTVIGSVIRASASALPPETSTQLDEVFGRIRTDMVAQVESLRRLMLAVRPPVLDEGTLRTALAVFVTDVFVEGPRLEVEVDIDPELVLDWTTETGVYRIIQEALQNVRQHADARTVTVTVAAPRDVLEITVTDDGVGFDPDAVLFESGIATMRLFASLNRGRVDLRSAPGEGTTVFVELGVTDEPPPEPPPPSTTLHLVVGGRSDVTVPTAATTSSKLSR